MSSVNAAGKRGPGVVRAAVGISFSCVLLGGAAQEPSDSRVWSSEAGMRRRLLLPRRHQELLINTTKPAHLSKRRRTSHKPQERHSACERNA